MDKIADSFKLETIEEVRVFMAQLSNWQKRRHITALDYINLENVFLKCKTLDSKDGGRLFSAVFDLRLTFEMLNGDLCSAFGSHNSIAMLTGNPLEDSNIFFNQMEELHYAINFIVRHRSFFDKFMGVLLLMYGDDSMYKNYMQSKSRKATFVSEARKCTQISSDLVDEIEKILVEFDNEFRTPEVHYTGRLRKWAFADIDYIDKPFVTLNKYWNFLLPVLTALDTVFRRELTTQGVNGSNVP